MKIIYCIVGLYNSGEMEGVLINKVNYLTNYNKYEIVVIRTDIEKLKDDNSFIRSKCKYGRENFVRRIRKIIIGVNFE